MEDQRAAELAVAFARLAGREIGADEACAVVARARSLSAAAANDIWARHRRAPRTVPLRDYLAMTVRFVEQAPPPPGSSVDPGPGRP